MLTTYNDYFTLSSIVAMTPSTQIKYFYSYLVAVVSSKAKLHLSPYISIIAINFFLFFFL